MPEFSGFRFGLLLLAAAGSWVVIAASAAGQESAAEFAQRRRLDPSLSRPTEERLLSVLAARRSPDGYAVSDDARFLAALEELCRSKNWILRRRGARLAAWMEPPARLRALFETYALHRDPAWPVRRAAWLASRGGDPKSLLPRLTDTGALAEPVDAVRMAWRESWTSLVPNLTPPELAGLRAEGVEDDLRSPDPALREATGRMALVLRQDQAMEAHLDDPGLPLTLRRLFATALAGRPEEERQERAQRLEGAEGIFSRYLRWLSRPKESQVLEDLRGLLRDEETALGEDLLRLGARTLAVNLVDDESLDERQRLRFLQLDPEIAKLLSLSPAAARPWPESALLFRLALLRSRRARRDLALGELRVRAIGRDARGEQPPWTPEFSAAMDAALEGEGRSELRSTVLDLLVRRARVPAAKVLFRLARERSDSLRRAALRGLAAREEVSDERLFTLSAPWLERGPGVAALKILREARPKFDLEAALVARVMKLPDSVGARAGLLGSSNAPGLRRALLTLRDRTRLDGDQPALDLAMALEERLVELGEARAIASALKRLEVKGAQARPRELLALGETRDVRLREILGAEDPRLREEPRLVGLAVAWRRDGAKNSRVVDFARQLLDLMCKQDEMASSDRRAMFEALVGALTGSELETLVPEVYRAACQRPVAGRVLWEALAGRALMRVDAEVFSLPQDSGTWSEKRLRRRTRVLRALRNDQAAAESLRREIDGLFGAPAPFALREELVSDLLIARGRVPSRWFVRAERALWIARRGRELDEEGAAVADWLLSLTVLQRGPLTWDELGHGRQGSKSERAEYDTPGRLSAWLRADTEAVLARPRMTAHPSLDRALLRMPLSVFDEAALPTLLVRSRHSDALSESDRGRMGRALSVRLPHVLASQRRSLELLERQARATQEPALFTAILTTPFSSMSNERMPHDILWVRPGLIDRFVPEDHRLAPRPPRDPVCAGRCRDVERAWRGNEGDEESDEQYLRRLAEALSRGR